ncbi:MAG: T9SS type A sorting domain-containing protein [Calditrichaeota bacterium]|nr:T9SS type A sorting domain-containing protein [Calditrichota bacterium]
MKKLLILLVSIVSITGLDIFAQEPDINYLSTYVTDFGESEDLVKVDDYLYISTGYTGLRILDISEAGQPEIIGNFYNETFCGKAVVDGDLLFVHDKDPYEEYSTCNINAYDISDRENPVLRNSLPIPSKVADFTVDDEKIYLLQSYRDDQGHRTFAKLVIYDNSEEPDSLGSITLEHENVGSLCLGNGTAFIGETDYQNSFIELIDISNPEEIQSIGTIQLDEYCEDWERPYIMKVQDEVLYVLTENYFFAFDIHNIQNIALLADINTQRESMSICDMLIDGDYAFLGGSAGGGGSRGSPFNFPQRDSYSDMELDIYDISDPADIRLIGEYRERGNEGNYFSHIAYVEDFIYGTIMYGVDGLVVFDISNPEELEPDVFSINEDYFSVNPLMVVRNGLYCGGDFSIFDISDPEYPELLNNPTDDDLRSARFTIHGNFAYLVKYNNLINIVDIWNPTRPELVNVFRVESGDFHAPIVVDDFLYVGLKRWNNQQRVYEHTLLKMSLDVPEEPELVDTLLLDGMIQNSWSLNGIIQHENYIILSWRHYDRDQHALFVVNIADPDSMSVESLYEAGDVFDMLVVSDTLLYCSENNGSILVYDISDINNFELVTNLEFNDYQTQENSSPQIALFDSLLVIGADNIFLYDLSNPIEPERVATYPYPFPYVSDLVVKDNVIIATNGDAISFYRVQNPHHVEDISADMAPVGFVLNPAYPNPFNSTTKISYSLPMPSHVSLEVYNLTGQQLKTLFEGQNQAGIHTTTLTANDLPTGLYFVRLNAGAEVLTQKIMLIK